MAHAFRYVCYGRITVLAGAWNAHLCSTSHMDLYRYTAVMLNAQATLQFALFHVGELPVMTLQRLVFRSLPSYPKSCQLSGVWNPLKATNESSASRSVCMCLRESQGWSRSVHLRKSQSHKPFQFWCDEGALWPHGPRLGIHCLRRRPPQTPRAF
jgi:hypothetical protein